VRLEADVASGELELRATVVDDDGRLTSFRRLVALVRGPQGFHRRVPLEAAGAGSYRARLPLDSPGAYVSTLEDEVSGATVATAGAALGLGDELRPTGSDAAFLGRLAEITRGKRRDTLAGIFDDRGKRRFAYEDASRALLVVAAFAWLLAIAARHLAWLDEPFVARLFGSSSARGAQPSEESLAQRSKGEAEPVALAIARERRERRGETESSSLEPHGEGATIMGRRRPDEIRAGVAPHVDVPIEGATSSASNPGSSLVATRHAELDVRSTAPKLASAAAPVPVDDVPRAEDGRPLTAAEILLARRKSRR
jgi:hypothetical protein